eukprot:890366-Lingulodinium_polyedra.AAC.1
MPARSGGSVRLPALVPGAPLGRRPPAGQSRRANAGSALATAARAAAGGRRPPWLKAMAGARPGPPSSSSCRSTPGPPSSSPPTTAR